MIIPTMCQILKQPMEVMTKRKKRNIPDLLKKKKNAIITRL
jgi:hypothetical protein